MGSYKFHFASTSEQTRVFRVAGTCKPKVSLELTRTKRKKSRPANTQTPEDCLTWSPCSVHAPIGQGLLVDSNRLRYALSGVIWLNGRLEGADNNEKSVRKPSEHQPSEHFRRGGCHHPRENEIHTNRNNRVAWTTPAEPTLWLAIFYADPSIGS